VHLRDFPSVPESWKNDALAADWFEIKKIRKQVLEAIEPKRAAKELSSSLEAKPILRGVSQTSLLQKRDMAEICITAPFEYEMEGRSIDIEKAPGAKCHRCWKVLPEVEENGELCNRCEGAVAKLQKAA